MRLGSPILFMDKTRLRFVYAKDPKGLVAFCEALPFKVEIKGNPVLQGKYWYLFFILPEVEGIEFNSGAIEL